MKSRKKKILLSLTILSTFIKVYIIFNFDLWSNLCMEGKSKHFHDKIRMSVFGN